MLDDFLNRARWGELFAVLGQAGFDPTKFEKTAGDGDWAGFIAGDVPTISYQDQPEYYFSMAKYIRARLGLGGVDTGLFAVAMAPGKVERWERRASLSWEEVVDACREWAGYLRAELETPDFWTQPRPEE
jgi:hypothetical protein